MLLLKVVQNLASKPIVFYVKLQICGKLRTSSLKQTCDSGVSGIEMLDDSGLSTGAAVAITLVVTFIVSVAVTAIITFIVTHVYVKKKFILSTTYQLPQEKEQVRLPTSPITKSDLKLQPNPAYNASHKVAVDTNTAAYEIMQVNESTCT